MTVPLIGQDPGHILFPLWEGFHSLGIETSQQEIIPFIKKWA